MSDNLTREQIETAVTWWIEALKYPKFDNGDDSDIGMHTMMLATIASPKVDESQVIDFGNSLQKSLSEADDFFLGIGVDYNPDRILSLALEAGEIKASITSLPWKTYMTFNNDGVQVSCGYGAPREDLSLVDVIALNVHD